MSRRLFQFVVVVILATATLTPLLETIDRWDKNRQSGFGHGDPCHSMVRWVGRRPGGRSGTSLYSNLGNKWQTGTRISDLQCVCFKGSPSL